LIVVDTSALMAILFEEPSGQNFAEKLLDQNAVMAAPNYLEAHMVLWRFAGERTALLLEETVRAMRIRVVPFTQEHALLAASTFDKFGKGRHSASLNFGDCIAYALSKSLNRPLLFAGNNFLKTDVARA
jgi:ribonuclease VapC